MPDYRLGPPACGRRRRRRQGGQAAQPPARARVTRANRPHRLRVAASAPAPRCEGLPAERRQGLSSRAGVALSRIADTSRHRRTSVATPRFLAERLRQGARRGRELARTLGADQVTRPCSEAIVARDPPGRDAPRVAGRIEQLIDRSHLGRHIAPGRIELEGRVEITATRARSARGFPAWPRAARSARGFPAWPRAPLLRRGTRSSARPRSRQPSGRRLRRRLRSWT